MKKIIIDPGHGGTDPGAVGHGLMEKNIALSIGLACRDYLLDTYFNVEVKMTRSTDVFIELKERSNIANKWGADVFCSIHCNANPNPAANGYESYIYNKFGSAASKERAEKLQYSIHKATAAIINMTDRGMRAANFSVLRETNMSAILTENGFISNSLDAQEMKSPQWIQRVAKAHADGLAAFLGLKKKPAPKAPVTQETLQLTDVASNSAYIDAIVWAINSGVMSEVNGQFGPNAPVTRAELARILHNYDLKQK